MDLNRVKEETEAALKALNELAADGARTIGLKSGDRKVIQLISKDEASRSGLADFFEDEEHPETPPETEQLISPEVVDDGYDDDQEDEATQMLPPNGGAAHISKNIYEKSKKMEVVINMQSTFDKLRQTGRRVPWGRFCLAILCVMFWTGIIIGGLVYVISIEQGMDEFFPGLGSSNNNEHAQSSSTRPPLVDLGPTSPVVAPKPRQKIKGHGEKQDGKHAREKEVGRRTAENSHHASGEKHAHGEREADHASNSASQSETRNFLRQSDT